MSVPVHPPRSSRWRGLAALTAAAGLLCAVAAACSASTNAATSGAGAHVTASVGNSPTAMDGMDDMGDMAGMPTVAPIAQAQPRANGLAAGVDGYVYLPSAETVAANRPGPFTFHITGPDDHALTRYQPYESKLVIFYLIRSDLSGFQRLDATMREDGTWTVALPALAPGTYRTYVTFAAPDSSVATPKMYVLSHALTVPGHAAAAQRLPKPSASVNTDGYAVTLSGVAKSGETSSLAVGVTKGGKPVDYFVRYLDGYAHLTAVRAGDDAFAHVLSTGRSGGSGALTAQTVFPESGTWRVFVQFEIGDTLHTAALTVTVP